MKGAVIVLFVSCAISGVAQSYGPSSTVLNNQPVIFEIPSHAEHASLRPLASPQNILESSQATSAQGVRPLWELPTIAPTPLGDVARRLRREHELKRKAVKIYSDQR
jgi:hypothetical protein